MTCILCELIDNVKPIYEDEFCYFIIGKKRLVPMGVVKVHGMPVPKEIKSHLTRKARELYGGKIRIAAPMSTVKNHYHIHVYEAD